ncbi:tyrosine-type recombinase/integrase [Plantactinospora sp. CA-294935]|uniref:tyrosine-type recombinase/integrase n=1 Tax=Plantactinospora sp. CA-294935 TaxID=3240012 RepID=UPI003D8E9EC7
MTQPDDHLARLVTAFIEGRKSDHTKAAYRRDLALWLQWCDTNRIDPLDAWPAHAQLWLSTLHRAGEAGTTRARRLGAVSSWYRWLVYHQAAPRNPAALLPEDRPAQSPKHAPALSDEHTAAILAQADQDTPRAAAIAWTLLQTGIRVGELTNANTGDVGLDRGHHVLHIIDGKGGKTRAVLLVPPVVARLDTYQATRRDTGTLVSADDTGAGSVRPLIATRTGGRLDRKAVRLLLQRLARAAKLPPEVADRLTPHTTRATYVTSALDEGASIYDVAREVGHSRTDTTQGYDRSHYDPSRSPAYKLMGRYARHLPADDPAPR